MARIAESGYSYRSSKTYVHSKGLSCCFRQWRATDSHCQYLHGYSLQVKVEFEATVLDERNWCIDFGGLKAFGAWLEATFDHKTLIAEDDPLMHVFQSLNLPQYSRKIYDNETKTFGPLVQLVVVPHVGCEEFARMIYEWLVKWIGTQDNMRHTQVKRVWINEHDANGASYGRSDRIVPERLTRDLQRLIDSRIDDRERSRVRTGI